MKVYPVMLMKTKDLILATFTYPVILMINKPLIGISRHIIHNKPT
jgi:hypothetical protein